MSWREVYRFYTHDGEWYPSSKPYSISQADADRFAAEIEAKGAGTHLFVRYKPGGAVRFYTSDNRNQVRYTCDAHGWCNHAVTGDSAYWGEGNGPWCVEIEGVPVLRGLGLPEGYHVSTFVVLSDGAAEPAPPPVLAPDFAYHNYVRIASYSVSESGILTRHASVLLPRAAVITLEELDAQGHTVKEQTIWRP